MNIQASMLDRSNLSNLSPKTRPIPTFFIAHTTFSTKKEKETPKLHEVYPPKPPVKSCPPISRLRPQRKPENGAKVISFINNATKNDSDVVSKHYDENKMDLFFDQCFVIEGTLGCGSFGKVYKVKNKEDGKYYAIKKSREKFKGNSDRIRKLEEVAKHEELPPHPNCVRFYRAWEEKQRLYIQIELCQMSLSTYQETHHDIPEQVIWQFLVDLIQAVKHLHDRNLLHMDIKPDNIFISYDGICKLGDFGLVFDLNKNDLTEAQEGDPKYLAPEVLKQGKYTKAADVFSLGMTILELATDLDVPRGGDGWHKLRTGRLPKDIKHNLSSLLVDIIVQMIDPNYMRRPNVDQLLSMPVIRKYVNQRKRKLLWLKFMSYFSTLYHRILRISLTIWYFIIYPYKKLTSNHQKLHQTSTPKRHTPSKVHQVSLMHLDDDDYDADNVINNDSFSTYNNSYGHPLNYTSSSSYSDNSDLPLAERLMKKRHAQTEPVHHNIKKTPEKTPKIKQLISFNQSDNSNQNTPTKTLGPARQKLTFDDNSESE